jgi:hypothetical protein
MKRRPFVVLLAFAIAPAAIALVSHLSAPLRPAAAARPAQAGGGSTAELTFTSTPTATPCPTCPTPTATPTSVRLPPMLAIDFTVNGSRGEIMVLQGKLMSIRTLYQSTDHRDIAVVDTVDLSDGGHGAGHCSISPGATCGAETGFSADHPGLITATLRVTAEVVACGLCPTLQKEHSVAIAVIAIGDFNCNNAVDSIDATLILQLTAALIQPFSCTGAGDANNDGYTNAIDVTLVLQYVAGLIPLFT